jgi:SH3-like domain-containing protein
MTIACFIFCLSFVFVSSLQAAEYVSVAKEEVNMRSGPSTKDQVIWEVFKAYPLQVMQRKNGWAQCLDFEGDKGWIYGPLLSKKKTVIVKKKKINLRNLPTTGNDSTIIALVKYGVVFEVIAKDGEWLKVKLEDSTEGWAHKDLVWPADPLD